MSNFPDVNLTGHTQASTYERLVQTSASLLFDGVGNLLDSVNVTSSYSLFSLNGGSGSTGTLLFTGSTYQITSSNTISASYAQTASFALNGGNGGTTLFTASTYQITSSWSQFSSFAITASYVTQSITQSIVSSSFASQSISSSYSNTASYLTNTVRNAFVSVNGAVLINDNQFNSISLGSGGVLIENTINGGEISLNSGVVNIGDALGDSILMDNNKITITCPLIVSNATIIANSLSSSNLVCDEVIADLFGTASNSISSSYAVTASFALNGGGTGTVLNTGSTYQITSSWTNNANTASYITSSKIVGTVLSSSYAITASFALNAGTLLITASTYQITASNTISASYSQTASFALNAGTLLTTGSTYQITSSWSNNSISASFSPINPAYSASISTQMGTKQNTIVTASLLPITSSWAISASWANTSLSSTSASFAFKSLSSSFAVSASWAPSTGTVNVTGIGSVITSSVNFNSSSYDGTNFPFFSASYSITTSSLYRLSWAALTTIDETALSGDGLEFHVSYTDEEGGVFYTSTNFLSFGHFADRLGDSLIFSAVSSSVMTFTYDTAGSNITGTVAIVCKLALEKLI